MADKSERKVKLDLSPFRLGRQANGSGGRVSCEPLKDRDACWFERWWWESEVDSDGIDDEIAIVQFVDDWTLSDLRIYLDICEIGYRAAQALHRADKENKR